MKKISIILISLLLFSAISTLSANFVFANVGAAVFCPNNFQWVDTIDEIYLSGNTSVYISDMLANYNSPDGCYISYNEDATVSRYCSILSDLTNYYDESIVFSKGHRGIPYYPYNDNHRSLLDHDGAHVMDSEHIFSRTTADNVFTFIWHCQTADHYEDESPWHDDYGYYGMPYCWTHNNALAKYGTAGNQVFLGWTGGSPQFNTTAYGTWNYAHVAYYFWYYMCDGDTVDNALNHVASTIWGIGDFDNTVLKNWLIVWGNMNLNLP